MCRRDSTVHIVGPRESYGALVNLLLLNEGGRCLVFVERRIDVSSLAAKLAGDGFAVQSLSGELPQVQRCALYTSPSPRDRTRSRKPSSA